MGDLIVILALSGLVIGIIAGMLHSKKKGKGCCGGCSGCAHACGCQKRLDT